MRYISLYEFSAEIQMTYGRVMCAKQSGGKRHLKLGIGIKIQVHIFSVTS